MKAMKPFYFVHPQYGKLRVVVIGGKIYYCLMDVKNKIGRASCRERVCLYV